jgi:hypothetical protein
MHAHDPHFPAAGEPIRGTRFRRAELGHALLGQRAARLSTPIAVAPTLGCFRNLIDRYGTNFGTKRLDAYQSQITSNSRLRAEVVLPAAPWDSR